MIQAAYTIVFIWHHRSIDIIDVCAQLFYIDGSTAFHKNMGRFRPKVYGAWPPYLSVGEYGITKIVLKTRELANILWFADPSMESPLANTSGDVKECGLVSKFKQRGQGQGQLN